MRKSLTALFLLATLELALAQTRPPLIPGRTLTSRQVTDTSWIGVLMGRRQFIDTSQIGVLENPTIDSLRDGTLGLLVRTGTQIRTANPIDTITASWIRTSGLGVGTDAPVTGFKITTRGTITGQDGRGQFSVLPSFEAGFDGLRGGVVRFRSEGGDGFSVDLQAPTSLTADRSITLPDHDGILILDQRNNTFSGDTNQFINWTFVKNGSEARIRSKDASVSDATHLKLDTVTNWVSPSLKSTSLALFGGSNYSGSILTNGLNVWTWPDRFNQSFYFTDRWLGTRPAFEQTMPHALMHVNRFGPASYNSTDDISAANFRIVTNSNLGTQANTVKGSWGIVDVGGSAAAYGSGGLFVPQQAIGLKGSVFQYGGTKLPLGVSLLAENGHLGGAGGFRRSVGLLIAKPGGVSSVTDSTIGIYYQNPGNAITGGLRAFAVLEDSGKILWQDVGLYRSGTSQLSMTGGLNVRGTVRGEEGHGPSLIFPSFEAGFDGLRTGVLRFRSEGGGGSYIDIEGPAQIAGGSKTIFVPDDSGSIVVDKAIYRSSYFVNHQTLDFTWDKGDFLRFRQPSKIERWNGSAWEDWASPPNFAYATDGIGATATIIPNTTTRFRLTYSNLPLCLTFRLALYQEVLEDIINSIVIETSPDNTNWTTRGTFVGLGQWHTYVLPSVSGQCDAHLRITIDVQLSDAQFSLDELRAYHPTPAAGLSEATLPITWDYNKNVGIGLQFADAHTDKLNVRGNAKLTGASNVAKRLRFEHEGGSSWDILLPASQNRLSIGEGGTEQLSVVSGGNVGIGTTSPNDKLEVRTSTNHTSGGGTVSGRFVNEWSGSGTVSPYVYSLTGANYLTLSSGSFSNGAPEAIGGVMGDVRIFGAGTFNTYANAFVSFVLRDGGYLQTAAQYLAYPPLLANGATINTAIGFRVVGQKVSGVNNGFGIYQEGVNDNNYFAGKIGIGTDAPAEKLHVVGKIKADGIKGVSDGSNAASGDVGEFLSVSVNQQSGAVMTTGETQNIMTLALSPGDWDVTGIVRVAWGTLTNIRLRASASSTSATHGADDLRHHTQIDVTDEMLAMPIPTSRFNVTTNTTVYMVVTVDFGGASEVTVFGSLRARRIR